jgi:hypothetical protein
MTNATSVRTEAIAGITTFFTMAYIVVVNPSILSTPGTGIAFSGALTATVLICFTMTLLMGLYAKLPFAVAPGMGINAFFTFTIILTQKVWWQVALGIVFWAGVLFMLISVTPIRETIAKAIPAELHLRSHHLRQTRKARRNDAHRDSRFRSRRLPVNTRQLARISRRDLFRHRSSVASRLRHRAATALQPA